MTIRSQDSFHLLRQNLYRVDESRLFWFSFNDICLPAFFLWSNAEFGKAGDEATISSSVITAEESLCFNFWFDLTVSIFPPLPWWKWWVKSLYFQHTDGIKELIIYMESTKDMSRTPVWDFNKAKFDFWEHGRVEIPKFEDFKVR